MQQKPFQRERSPYSISNHQYLKDAIFNVRLLSSAWITHVQVLQIYKIVGSLYGSTLPKLRIISKKASIKIWPPLNLLAFLQFRTKSIFNR